MKIMDELITGMFYIMIGMLISGALFARYRPACDKNLLKRMHIFTHMISTRNDIKQKYKSNVKALAEDIKEMLE